MNHVHIKRIYQEPGPGDGYRVLVDRLWPRGVAKEAAALDEWCREVTPSTGLRQWYGHDPAKFEEFARRYRAELDGAEPVARLRELSRRATLTLLTATREVDLSAARVLAEVLEPDC